MKGVCADPGNSIMEKRKTGGDCTKKVIILWRRGIPIKSSLTVEIDLRRRAIMRSSALHGKINQRKKMT